jgi:hypothetical protein
VVFRIGARADRAPDMDRAAGARRTLVRVRPAASSRVAGIAATFGLIAAAFGSPGVAAGTPALLGLDTPPVALADGYTTTYEHALVRARPGVLGNDLDADGDGLVASLGSAPRHGSLDLSADGSFTYRPDDGFSGIDTFTYAASDGQAASLPALVTLTVGPAPPSPTPTPKPTPKSTPAPTPTPSVIVLPSLPPLPTLPPILPTPTPRPTPASSPTPAPSSAPSARPSALTSAGGAGMTTGGGTTTGPGGTATGPADPVARDGATTALPAPDTSGGGATGANGPLASIDVPILGTLSIPTDWVVPGLVLAVPGMLLIIAVIAQALGAVVWLPLIRRSLHRKDDDRIPRRKRRDSLVS